MTNIEDLGFNESHQYDIEELIALRDIELKKQKEAIVINKFTGEVRPFRSMANPGNYHDSTVIVAPSDTDTSEYEPLETTIERCSRSGYLKEYMAKMELLDKQNALDEDPSDFDFAPDEVERPGYDISDARESLANIEEDLRHNPIKANEGEATSEPASANASPSEPVSSD